MSFFEGDLVTCIDAEDLKYSGVVPGGVYRVAVGSYCVRRSRHGKVDTFIYIETPTMPESGGWLEERFLRSDLPQHGEALVP